MRRSDVNARIKEAEVFFAGKQLHLPPWAHWTPSMWKECAVEYSEITENQLGWDLTDFGSGDFASRGLLLFTCRNGNPARDRKTYAEKIMLVQEGQETPMHFHWHKMEDIINRGGGNLVLELHASTEQEELSQDALAVSIDGVRRIVEAGEPVVLHPGESITLEKTVYHRFYGEPGYGPVLVGEVSMVNDDATDNRFLETLPRFSPIEEDEEPYRLLAIDYPDWCS